MSDSQDLEAIRALLAASNRAWRENRMDDLRRLLHEDVVFVGADLQVLGRGRDACVRTYQDFVTQAEVHRFDARPAAVHVVGKTAVATYNWSTSYTFGGRRYDERGREMLVCLKAGRSWQIVWRAQFPLVRP